MKKCFLLFVTLLTISVTNAAQNPVIAGDWSDPGIFRVGEDYYSVRSTFGWQPGLHISHSKDLIHWETIGHAFKGENDVEIPTAEVWGGIWGSDMVYNPNTKEYLVYAPLQIKQTQTRDIYVFSSKKPEGPYSRGTLILKRDIDPGVFVDRDGTLYLSSKASVIYRLTPDGKQIQDSVCLVKGNNGKAFGEGAEIVRRGEYYYYTCSEGGTLPYEHHKILSFRAKNIEGPWEGDPTNPIKYAPHTSKAPIQGPGHGELIETQYGEWYLTYHAYELDYPTLARQMCMEPVKWTEDGWWRPVDDSKLPPVNFRAPNLPASDIRANQSDEFDSKELAPQWFFHTKPDYSGKAWSIKDGAIKLNDYAGDRDLASTLERFIMQRMEGKQYTIETRMRFSAKDEGQMAGLLLYVNCENYLQFGISKYKGEQVVCVKSKCGAFNRAKRICRPVAGSYFTNVNAPYEGDEIYLRIEVLDPQTAKYYYSTDGKQWSDFGTYENFFGRGGDPDLGWQHTYWTGGTMGICIDSDSQSPQRREASAEFDYYRVVQK